MGGMAWPRGERIGKCSEKLCAVTRLFVINNLNAIIIVIWKISIFSSSFEAIRGRRHLRAAHTHEIHSRVAYSASLSHSQIKKLISSTNAHK